MSANLEILNSWKEVAVYLGRGVRTVQRWERDLNLPVRRPRGTTRSAVIALKQEVDQWLLRTPTEILERKESSKPNLLKREHPGFKTLTLISRTQELVQRSNYLCQRSRELCFQMNNSINTSIRLRLKEARAQNGLMPGSHTVKVSELRLPSAVDLVSLSNGREREKKNENGIILAPTCAQESF